MLSFKLKVALLATGYWLLATGAAQGATKLILHTASASQAGYKEANPIQGASMTTAVTNTAASGTDIQVTATGGGSTVAWISKPLASGFTMAGSATCNLWGLESAANKNTSFRCRMYKFSGGSEGAAIWLAEVATELGTSVGNKSVSANPTSTAFSAGDRIVIKIFLENCTTSGCPTGTMGGGGTATLDYDGATGAADGDTYVSITENVTFNESGAAAISLANSPAVTASVPVSRAAAASLAVSCPVCVDVNRPSATNVSVGVSPAVSAFAPKSAAAPASLSLSPAVAALSGKNVGIGVALALSPGATGVGQINQNGPAAVSLQISPGMSIGLTAHKAAAVSLGVAPAVATPRALGVQIAAAFNLGPAAGTSRGMHAASPASINFSPAVTRLAAHNENGAAAVSLHLAPAGVRVLAAARAPAAATQLTVLVAIGFAGTRNGAVALVVNVAATAVVSGTRRAVVVVT